MCCIAAVSTLCCKIYRHEVRVTGRGRDSMGGLRERDKRLSPLHTITGHVDDLDGGFPFPAALQGCALATHGWQSLYRSGFWPIIHFWLAGHIRSRLGIYGSTLQYVVPAAQYILLLSALHCQAGTYNCSNRSRPPCQMKSTSVEHTWRSTVVQS